MRGPLELAGAVARTTLRCSSGRAASGALAGTSKASTLGALAAFESATSSSSSIRSRFFPGFSGSRRAFSSAEAAGAALGGSSSSRRGPVSYASLALTMATGAGIVFYYDYLKHKKVKAALEGAANAKGKGGASAATAGAAAIGGPFSLVDASGKPFTDQKLVDNGWHLLYFGFTRCPDICPDELEKIAAVTDALEVRLKEKEEKEEKKKGGGESGAKDSKLSNPSQNRITPVFISVDPERDPPAHVGAYVKEFHPRMLGLTGTVAQCRAAARAYRVYYARAAASPVGDESEASGKKKKKDEIDGDYLIDHSIITYLIDPQGKFVTFFGKNVGAEEMVESVLARVGEWKKEEEEEGEREEKGEKEKK